MALVIKPNNEFIRHAGELRPHFDRYDPRKPTFDSDQVDVDFRECLFVRPQAALWCLVFLLLAKRRGAHCRLLVPREFGVCVYLKLLGIFDILKENDVEVDDRDIPESRHDQKTILPITQFTTTADATSVTNLAFANLQSADVGAVNIASTVTELFSELALNAAQHSESEIGAFGYVQFFESQDSARLTCAVADGGIGILASLSRNPNHAARVSYDWDALELSVRERVSGTGDPHRGIGLYGVSEDVRRPSHSLLIHSGIGSLEINEEVESSAKRTRLFPGTLAFISVPA